jgi:hypothetical protein
MVCVELVGPIYSHYEHHSKYIAFSLSLIIMIDPATDWFEIIEAKLKSATSIQNFFMTPGWHISLKM